MSPSQPTARIQLLHAFAVTLPGGRTVTRWGRPTARRLVQLLALSPRHRRTREQVADALFPNLDPRRAANAVAKAASMARAAMGPRSSELLLGDRDSLWLDELKVRVDLDGVVETLRAAQALPANDERDMALVAALGLGGTLLPDEPYAEWASGPRAELERLRQEARLALARQRAAGTGRSDPESVLDAWSSVAAADPASEEAAVALMEVHASAGRRDGAVRAYLRCMAALRDQLGTVPGPRLQAAFAALKPDAEPRPHETVWGERFGDARLFGRDALLRRLRRRLGATPAGDGPVVYLTGPAGIGKSVLVRAIARDLERAGWRILFGASSADDRQAPFAALGVALAPLLGSPGWGEAPLLAQTLWGSSSDDDPARVPAAAALARMAVELGALLDHEGEVSPVLLAIDDIQWADPALQAVIGRLATRPERRRWALLAAARDDEPGAPLPAVAPLDARLRIPPLALRPLRAAIRASLALEGLRPRSAVVDRSIERSGGNPFFGIELARDAAASSGEPAEGDYDRPVPDAIIGLLRRRFDRISEPARTLLSIAALAGTETTYETLLETSMRLGGSVTDQAAGAIDELIEAGLVLEAGVRLSLTHPLLREAAISTTNAVRRSAVHVAIADALDSMADRLHPPDRQLSARHRLAAFTAARLPATAAPAADAGFREGQRARRIYADDAAFRLLREALGAFEILPAAERLARADDAAAAWLTIGHIRLDADDVDAAGDAYRRALDLVRRETEAARAWSAMGGIPYRRGRLREALATYREGLRMLPGADPLAAARLESDAAWVLLRLGRAKPALRILRRIAPILETSTETHVRCRLRDRLGLALRAVGREQEALEEFDAGIADAVAHGDERELMVLCTHRAPLLSVLGRHADAAADAQRAAAIAEMAQDRYSRAVVHWVTAEILDRGGQLQDALAERDAEVRLLVAIDNARNLAIAQTHRALLHARLGNAVDASAAETAARAAMRRAADPRLTTDLEAQLATVAATPESGKSSGTPVL